MPQLPQTTPISHIRINQEKVLAKLANGPVVLIQKNEPAAILVSPDEWNRMTQRLESLEQERRDRIEAERVATAFASDDLKNRQQVQEFVLEAIQKYRDELERYGPLENRRRLTAEEFERGEGDDSCFISGEELRKVLVKKGLKVDES